MQGEKQTGLLKTKCRDAKIGSDCATVQTIRGLGEEHSVWDPVLAIRIMGLAKQFTLEPSTLKLEVLGEFFNVLPTILNILTAKLVLRHSVR